MSYVKYIKASKGWRGFLSSYSNSRQQEDTATVTNESLAGSERQHKAQLSELINRHKDDTKRIYNKYDKQKEFISIAAHELRLPITPILGVVELIKQEFEETGENEITLKKELFEIILRNTTRLQKLATDILDVSRITDQSPSLKKEHFTLSYNTKDHPC